MNQGKTKNKTENIEVCQAQQNREAVLRKKRIRRYKNSIVTMICIISLLPTVFSVYLLMQVTKMESQVSYLADQREASEAAKMAQAQIEETNSQVVEATGSKGEKADAEGDVKEGTKGQNVKEAVRVYLTFDDGPSKNTDEILDILKKNQVKATFFVVAKKDGDSMAAYKRIVEEGHGIGIHSYTHVYNDIYASLEAFQKDVNSMSDLIYAATGQRTHLYRFPGGSGNSVCSTSMNQLIKWLNKEGYIYYDWNALNGDAVTKDLSVDTLISNVMDGVVKNGERDSIVLMHDLANRHNTVESLQGLIDQLKEKGYLLDEPINENAPLIQQKTLD